VSDSIHELLRRLLLDEMGVDVPSVETDLFEEALLDSLQFVQLLALLEARFHITLSPEDVDPDHFRSVVCIARFLERAAAPGADAVPRRSLQTRMS
jgi:acyl carrier protein